MHVYLCCILSYTPIGSSLFYKDGFAFTARFDRCYMRGESLKLQSFRLVGNRSILPRDGGNGSGGDYLSDHYGLAVQIEVVDRKTETWNRIVSSTIQTTDLLLFT